MEIVRQAEDHLDADELYRRAREKLPTLSLSTVYRNLRLFRELGMVEEHRLGSFRSCYEVKPRTRHHHLICLGCGKVIEFQCPVTEKLKFRMMREEGFQVTDAEVRLEGYCPQCRERLSGSQANTKKKQ